MSGCASELGDGGAIDPVRPYLGVAAVGQADDDPWRARPRLGVRHVGLRRVRRGARVRGVERGDLEARLVDGLQRAHDLERVDLEAQRAVGGVRHAEHALGAPVAAGTQPAALVRSVLAGVGDDLLEVVGGEPHAPEATGLYLASMEWT